MIQIISNYITARIPNIVEFFYSICFYAFINTIFERYIDNLGKDTTAKFVIQDTSTAVSVSLLKNAQSEVGSTGDKYDEGSEISIVSRVICKVSIIGYHASTHSNITHEKGSLSFISKLSNLPCEIISRIPVVASIELQKKKILYKNYAEYLNAAKANVEPFWFYESIGGGVIKILVANQIEEIAKYANYSETIKSYSRQLDEIMVNSIISKPSNNCILEGDIWSKMHIIHEIAGNKPETYLTDSLMLANSISSNILIGTINHYLFSPFTKAARDFSENYIKHRGFTEFSVVASTMIGCGALVKYVALPIIMGGFEEPGFDMLIGAMIVNEF